MMIRFLNRTLQPLGTIPYVVLILDFRYYILNGVIYFLIFQRPLNLNANLEKCNTCSKTISLKTFFFKNLLSIENND